MDPKDVCGFRTEPGVAAKGAFAAVSSFALGLLFCLSFVTLEAVQAVYLGAVFQDVDSFLIGTWVFGITVVGCVGATAILRPGELLAALRSPGLILGINVLAALAWTTYFIAIQIIEPAVVFTVFSGMVPLATVLAARLGMPEARGPSHDLSRTGNALILLAIAILATTTGMGLSGFVRGGTTIAILGVLLAAVSGGLTACVILLSVRLNGRGVGPLAQFGLRFILYTLVAVAAVRLGIDDKGADMSAGQIAVIVGIGLIVIALPLYCVQRAVPLVPAMTIAAITALGPVIVFGLQMVEGRVAYAPATLAGLLIYMSGALAAAWGAVRGRHAHPRFPGRCRRC